MRCNAAGQALIKQAEGCRLTPYKDQNGVWTVGYGCTMGVVPGQDITQDQADAMFLRALANVENVMGKLIKRPLSDNQWSALCSLTYNIGAGHFKQSSALQLINAGQFAQVPAAIAKWNLIGGQVSQGLVNRRSAEIKLWNTPDKANPAQIAPSGV